MTREEVKRVIKEIASWNPDKNYRKRTLYRGLKYALSAKGHWKNRARNDGSHLEKYRNLNEERQDDQTVNW